MVALETPLAISNFFYGDIQTARLTGSEDDGRDGWYRAPQLYLLPRAPKYIRQGRTVKVTEQIEAPHIMRFGKVGIGEVGFG